MSEKAVASTLRNKKVQSKRRRAGAIGSTKIAAGQHTGKRRKKSPTNAERVYLSDITNRNRNKKQAITTKPNKMLRGLSSSPKPSVVKAKTRARKATPRPASNKMKKKVHVFDSIADQLRVQVASPELEGKPSKGFISPAARLLGSNMQ